MEAETEEKNYGLQGKAEIHSSKMAKMQARKMEIAVSIDQLQQELQVIYDQEAEQESSKKNESAQEMQMDGNRLKQEAKKAKGISREIKTGRLYIKLPR